MPYIPDVPLWGWMVQGADVVYFSQPTVAWLHDELMYLGHRSSCVARCQHHYRYVLDHELPPRLTPPRQCGRVAALDLQGRYYCAYHMSSHWECIICDAPLAQGEGGCCSEACQTAFDGLAAEMMRDNDNPEAGKV